MTQPAELAISVLMNDPSVLHLLHPYCGRFHLCTPVGIFWEVCVPLQCRSPCPFCLHSIASFFANRSRETHCVSLFWNMRVFLLFQILHKIHNGRSWKWCNRGERQVCKHSDTLSSKDMEGLLIIIFEMPEARQIRLAYGHSKNRCSSVSSALQQRLHCASLRICLRFKLFPVARLQVNSLQMKCFSLGGALVFQIRFLSSTLPSVGNIWLFSGKWDPNQRS